jgi:D-aspartate ligase
VTTPLRAADSGQGALVVGGDYRALGIVRSLGRRGIPVWVAQSSTGDHRLASTSRFSRRHITYPEDEKHRLSFFLELGERAGLTNWTLFASADSTAAFVARHHAELATQFRLTTPPWSSSRWAYDKRLTYELAARLGVPYPRVFTPASSNELARYFGPFPAILKPATRPRLDGPRAKAWPVGDRAELSARYDEIAPLMEPGALMIQELIPGAGGQLSVAALCQGGEPLVATVAERVRQYPMDFGRSSTYVRTIEDREVVELARRVLAELRLDGLVEIEFKRDHRDGLCKLLDINLRVWGWHTIGNRRGLDFVYLAWLLANGYPVAPIAAPAGLRWLRMTTDLPAALSEIRRGQLSLPAYLRTLVESHDRAVAALDDPLPGVLELPMFLLDKGKRLSRGIGFVMHRQELVGREHVF